MFQDTRHSPLTNDNYTGTMQGQGTDQHHDMITAYAVTQ